MSDVTNKDTRVLFWQTYIHSPEEMQRILLEEVDLERNLNLVTWRGQIAMLDGAPPEILMKYLPKTYWMAQVVLYHELPVKLLKEAGKKLDERARVKLGLAEKKRRAKWSYRALC